MGHDNGATGRAQDPGAVGPFPGRTSGLPAARGPRRPTPSLGLAGIALGLAALGGTAMLRAADARVPAWPAAQATGDGSASVGCSGTRTPQAESIQPGQVRLGEAPTFPARPAGLRTLQADEAAPPAQGLDGGGLAVNPANREASRRFYIDYYEEAAAPADLWDGSRATCTAGTTSAAFRDAVLLRVNYFRAMAGVPAQVSLSGTYEAKAQQAALMMSANSQLSHTPPSSWLCYTADGAEAAGKSNLALGVHGASAVTAYIWDRGVNNAAAGHRRWVLYPQTQTMGTGDVPPTGGWASNDLWVFDSHMWDARPATREEYVAWPPPGYVPYQVVFPRWSFSYPSADFSQATVTMRQGLQAVTVALETVKNGYGENTLVWIPNGMADSASWPRPDADTSYQVTIDQVMVGGSPRTFTYTVVVMDPSTASPAVDSVLPARGAVAGGTAVTITGANFVAGQTTVTMGGVAATGVNVAGATSLTATTPPHAAGPVDVVVTTPGGSGTLAAGFRYAPPRADFTGGGTSAVVWQHATSGQLWLWPMSAGTVASYVHVADVAVGWEVRGVGDQTGDGRADLLWRHRDTGVLFLWTMQGTTPTAYAYVGSVDPVYDIVGTGDYDGDGKSDLLWRHQATGELWLWLMDGATIRSVTGLGVVPVAYAVVGSGDVNGDGRADVVWRHASNGEVWVWLMNGATPTQQAYLGSVADPGWSIVGVDDVSGDGRADLVWRHATNGEAWVWLMNGVAITQAAWVGTVGDPNYRIVGTGDYNGDGRADLLWHHATTGDVWVWLMHGAGVPTPTWVVRVADVDYQVRAPR